MKNVLAISALLLALGLIGYLYLQLTATQEALQLANQRFSDCETVTFQLQNQLASRERTARGERIIDNGPDNGVEPTK